MKKHFTIPLTIRLGPYQFRKARKEGVLLLFKMPPFPTLWTCTIRCNTSTIQRNVNESLLNIIWMSGSFCQESAEWTCSLTWNPATTIHCAELQVLLEIGNILTAQNHCNEDAEQSQPFRKKCRAKREDKMESFRKCVHFPQVCYYFWKEKKCKFHASESCSCKTPENESFQYYHRTSKYSYQCLHAVLVLLRNHFSEFDSSTGT